MPLEFPNTSRSFEVSKKRVRFWGYDQAIEITFFVHAETLAKIDPGAGPSEQELLLVFDSAIERIHGAARTAYNRSKRYSYAHVLSLSDF